MAIDDRRQTIAPDAQPRLTVLKSITSLARMTANPFRGFEPLLGGSVWVQSDQRTPIDFGGGMGLYDFTEDPNRGGNLCGEGLNGHRGRLAC
jgi:hypothetical protein